VFDATQFDGHPSDVYVVADDADRESAAFSRARRTARVPHLDAGRLPNARFVERMTLFIAEPGRATYYFPRMKLAPARQARSRDRPDTLGPLMEAVTQAPS